MKRNRKIGILLGIFLLVSVAAIGVSKYEQQKEIIRNSDEIIMEVAKEEVNALSWECDTGSFAFRREENGNWIYDADEAFPVDEEKINDLLGTFEKFGVSFRIEEVEDFGQYGLNEPVCSIQMETETQNYEILLGNYSEMDSERYVSIGDGNTYLVKEDPLDKFEVELSDLIKHDEIPAFEDATQVQFDGTEAEVIVYREDSGITYSAEDVYFMERDEGLLALDTARVREYLDTVRNPSLNEYVTYNVSEEEMKTYGMDAPELSIQVDYTTTDEAETEGDKEEDKTGTFTLYVSRNPAEQEAERKKEETEEEAGDETGKDAENTEENDEEVTAYARVGESQIIYRITAEQYNRLMDMSYDTLRHQGMFWADFADMSELTVVLDSETYTITSKVEDEKRTYYYRDEEVEMASIRSAVRGLEALEFTGTEPTQKEEIGLTISLDNEKHPEVSIQLYRYDGEKCIAVVDGETVAFVERAKVVDLVEAVHAIVLD